MVGISVSVISGVFQASFLNQAPTPSCLAQLSGPALLSVVSPVMVSLAQLTSKFRPCFVIFRRKRHRGRSPDHWGDHRGAGGDQETLPRPGVSRLSYAEDPRVLLIKNKMLCSNK